MKRFSWMCAAALALAAAPAAAVDEVTQIAADGATQAAPYDSALARVLGADEMGMRGYVLVILKTGPTRVPAGPERDAMFAGHFANMKRLSDAGKLVMAGPLDGVDGWRGLYVFATKDLEEAKAFTATDPVIIKGEMVAEYHSFYGSAALMTIRDTHESISKKKM